MRATLNLVLVWENKKIEQFDSLVTSQFSTLDKLSFVIKIDRMSQQLEKDLIMERKFSNKPNNNSIMESFERIMMYQFKAIAIFSWVIPIY